MKLFSRADQSFLGAWWWTIDRSLIFVFLALITAGVMLVSTASPPIAESLNLDSNHFLYRHLFFVTLGLITMFGMSFMPPAAIRRIMLLLFAGAAIAMVMTFLIGMEIKGARRWLHIFGFSVQPSEFAKPAFFILAAGFLAKGLEESEPLTRTRSFWIACGLYLSLIFLLLKQPDIGMSAVVTFVFGLQLFLAGLPLLFFVLLGAGSCLALVLAYFTFSHVQSRIDRFLFPESGDNYQVEQSLEAFQAGGLFGVGPGQGTVKLNIPDSHSDFIFAVAGEELGALFALVILGLYCYLMMRGCSLAARKQSAFAQLSVGGLLAMIGAQAFIHIGSSLYLLPTKGMTLPFMSYGGSSFIAICISAGVVIALTRKEPRMSISKAGLSTFSLNKKLINRTS